MKWQVRVTKAEDKERGRRVKTHVVDNVKRKPAGSEWKVDATCGGEGDQREPFERHEEETDKKVVAEEKSDAGGMSPRSPASWAEMREELNGHDAFFVWNGKSSASRLTVEHME